MRYINISIIDKDVVLEYVRQLKIDDAVLGKKREEKNRMKKLLLLGGTRYTIAAIEAAHKIQGGVHVITADYLPDNIAHKYSDEYCNINITNPEEVLKAAKKLEVNGIISFATDPGVVSAAYVAEQLGLPMPAPYKSVVIMQNKDKFRDFLEQNGFNVPKHMSFTDKADACQRIGEFTFPVVVKPVDSAGSKGVKRVDSIEELNEAIDNALQNSLSKRFIVEQFIEMIGSQSGSDSFVKDGKLVFATFDRQYYDRSSANPFTPAAMCYPSDMPEKIQKQLKDDIQRVVSLLNIGTTIINVECRFGTDGRPYIMELSPRAGGNRVPEIVSLSSGTDIILNNVKAALGLPVDNMVDPVYDSSYARVVLHSDKSGIFRSVQIDRDVEEKYLIEKDLLVMPGDKVEAFISANKSLGLLFMHFPNIEVADNYLNRIKEWVHVEVG